MGIYWAEGEEGIKWEQISAQNRVLKDKQKSAR